MCEIIGLNLDYAGSTANMDRELVVTNSLTQHSRDVMSHPHDGLINLDHQRMPSSYLSDVEDQWKLEDWLSYHTDGSKNCEILLSPLCFLMPWVKPA